MDAIIELFHSLQLLFWSLLNVVVDLVNVILPWLPLLAWVGFWTLAVNWIKAFDILRRGGFIGLLLLMFVAVLVWGAVAPPVLGHHSLFGLTVGNYAGKFIYVIMLTCIALLCGSAQMNGFAQGLVRFDEEDESNAH
jgi:hypothetical protein